jgi:TPR repeat protein
MRGSFCVSGETGLSYSHETMVEMYMIRDHLVGQNFVQQDIKKALDLAASCEHDDAKWLTNLFADREVNLTDKEQLKRVFLEVGDSDPRALGLAGVITGSYDWSLIRKSAESGYPYAQVVLAIQAVGEEKFLLAKKSAESDERGGFAWLAYCYHKGNGVEQSEEMAKRYYKKAAVLGLVLVTKKKKKKKKTFFLFEIVVFCERQ